jgi:regulator of sirC expression with transglutaminase-like and TPR domain
LDDLKRRLRGLTRDAKFDEKLLKAMLAAATPNDIFARMLRNLRAIHRHKGEPLKALSASTRIITLLPHVAEEYRERGQLYRELECFRAALADFRSYLRMKPDAADSHHVSRSITELEPIAASLN